MSSLFRLWFAVFSLAFFTESPAFSTNQNCISAFDASPIEKWMQQKEPLNTENVGHIHVSVVIPVYREWSNNHLRRILKSFASQTANSKNFELIFVVNNTPEAAAQKNDAFVENQTTIAYLRSLISTPNTLYIQEDSTMRVVRNARLKIRLLDHSSPDVAVPRVIGSIRQLGNQDISDRALINKHYHIVALSDADSVVDPRYILQLQNAFAKDPALTSAVHSMEFSVPPGSSSYIYRTFYDQRLYYENIDLFAALSGTSARFGTPRIAIRLDTLLELGGMANVEEGEDIDLIARMTKVGKTRSLWRYPVVTADRARAEGFDASYRFYKQKAEEAASSQLKEESKEDDHFHDYRAADLLTALYANVDPNELAILHAQTNHLLQNLERDRVALSQRVQHIMNTPASNVSRIASHRWHGNVNITSEQWFHAFVKELQSKYEKQDEYLVLSRDLPEHFPDYFGPTSRASGPGQFAVVRALESFLRIGWSYPREFPTLHSFLEDGQFRWDIDLGKNLVSALDGFDDCIRVTLAKSMSVRVLDRAIEDAYANALKADSSRWQELADYIIHLSDPKIFNEVTGYKDPGRYRNFYTNALYLLNGMFGSLSSEIFNDYLFSQLNRTSSRATRTLMLLVNHMTKHDSVRVLERRFTDLIDDEGAEAISFVRTVYSEALLNRNRSLKEEIDFFIGVFETRSKPGTLLIQLGRPI